MLRAVAVGSETSGTGGRMRGHSTQRKERRGKRRVFSCVHILVRKREDNRASCHGIVVSGCKCHGDKQKQETKLNCMPMHTHTHKHKRPHTHTHTHTHTHYHPLRFTRSISTNYTHLALRRHVRCARSHAAAHARWSWLARTISRPGR